MELIYLKSALKYDSFDVAIDIKIQFFRVLVTIEPGRSLLQFVTTNCLKEDKQNSWVPLSLSVEHVSHLALKVYLCSGVNFAENFGTLVFILVFSVLVLFGFGLIWICWCLVLGMKRG